MSTTIASRRKGRRAGNAPKPIPPPTQPLSVVEYGGRRLLIVAGVMLAALLQTLDATIVNVALPTIEGNIGASIDDGTWIITGYIVSNVVAIPLAPFMLARLGRRQYFATCVIGFTVASFFCGTASTLGGLVFFRVVQGAFGGGLIATSQIILRDTFPQNKLGASSALFAVALTLGPALGPTLGGVLTDTLSWQWVFDINLVPGTIAAIIILTTLRNPLPPVKMRFDAVGVALLAVALGSLQYVLDEGERNDWFDDGRIVAFTVACAVGLVAFVVWELFGTTQPIVDLRIFRYRNVRFGVPAAILLGMVVFGPLVLLPQYVQDVLGFSATLAGMLILLRALPVMFLTPLVARYATRLDPRILLGAGFCASALSFAMISQRMTVLSDFSSFTLALVISGIGQAMLLVPLLIAVLGSVKPQDSPKSSSFISLSVQLGGSIVSALSITALDRRTYFHSDVYRTWVNLRSAASVALPHGLDARIFVSRLVAVQALNAGFADAVALLVPVALLALLPVWLLARQRRVTARGSGGAGLPSDGVIR